MVCVYCIKGFVSSQKIIFHIGTNVTLYQLYESILLYGIKYLFSIECLKHLYALYNYSIFYLISSCLYPPVINFR